MRGLFIGKLSGLVECDLTKTVAGNSILKMTICR